MSEAGKMVLILAEIQSHIVIFANVYTPNIADLTFMCHLLVIIQLSSEVTPLRC